MDDQTKLWNGVAGNAWVDSQALMDQVLKPLETLLVREVVELHPQRVLDIGCGTGATTVAMARALGPASRCMGLDISEPMVAGARARAEREGSAASFLCANAQTFGFEGERYDMIASRFGVMFFDDPVQAFLNLRGAADGNLRLLTWRGPKENPFMTVAEKAAISVLPDLPPRVPDTPGQFGLADAQRTERILKDSGWRDIEIRPVDVPCTFAEKDLESYFTRLGPVGLALNEANPETRARVIEVVRPVFAPYVHGAEVRFNAACWMVSARSDAA